MEKYYLLINIFSLFEDTLSQILIELEKSGQLNKVEIESLKKNTCEAKSCPFKSNISFPNKISALKKRFLKDKEKRKSCHGISIIRNVMHSNGVYHGNEEAFYICGEKYQFKNGEIVKGISLKKVLTWIDELVVSYELIEKEISVKIRDNSYEQRD